MTIEHWAISVVGGLALSLVALYSILAVVVWLADVVLGAWVVWRAGR